MTPAPAILLLAASAYGPVVVVAPEGPPSAETAWIGAAVADALPRDLGLLKVPAVDRADLRQTLEKLGLTGAPVTRASAIRVAEALSASRLVTGSYVSEDAQVTLSLRLLDVEHATLSAPLIATGPLARLPELIAGLAWDIALAGSTRPASSREEFLALEPPVPLDALRAYARALSVSDSVVRARLLRRVLGLRPAYDEARLALGRLQVETREYEGALESLKRIKAASRVGRTARFLEGVAFLGLGRYAEASELYAALVAEGPSPAALNNQALALLRLAPGTPRASAVLRRAIDLDRNAVDLAFNLGFALLTEGQAEAATFWLETVVGRDPADARAQVVLAWASRMVGREAEADALWRQAVAHSPSYETLATPDLARRFERIRDSEGPPLRGSDESGDAGPAATLVAHAEALMREDRLDDALIELRRAVYLEPADPRIHLLLARLYRTRGDTEQALASFHRSLWSRDDAAVRLEMDSLASSPNR